MSHSRARRLAFSLFLALTPIVLPACTSRQASDFIPKEADSREALTTALTAWKNGEKWEKIPAGQSTIQVLDNKWRAGQQLADFQILEADPAGAGPQWFTVKLVMKKPAGELKVRYVVVGIDPPWPDEEDYNKSSGYVTCAPLCHRHPDIVAGRLRRGGTRTLHPFRTGCARCPPASPRTVATRRAFQRHPNRHGP